MNTIGLECLECWSLDAIALVLVASDLYEMPRMVQTHIAVERIAKALPYNLLCDEANAAVGQAMQAEKKQHWNRAISAYLRCQAAMERFRGPDTLKSIQQCYVECARCAIAAGRGDRGLYYLRQATAIDDAPAEVASLLDEAQKLDARSLDCLKKLHLVERPTVTQLDYAVSRAVYSAQTERLDIAAEIAAKHHHFFPESAASLLALARCHMARGRGEDALSLLGNHPENEVQLKYWRDLLQPAGRHTKLTKSLLKRPYNPLDCVNLGLMFLVNALYREATYWLGVGLKAAPDDPFGILGHAFLLWSLGWFNLAADRFRKAERGIREYPHEFRFLIFGRIDSTSAPRSYEHNPMYLLFNPEECLQEVNRRQPFVSAAVFP